MKVLVTGGAGYIGGFMAQRLLDDGQEVVVLDSLERGKKEMVDSRATLEVGNLQNREFVSEVFSRHQLHAVIHFAGFISMAESMKEPGLYFSNNTFSTQVLLEVMHEKGVNKIIFSSTAGVYGNPKTLPIPEDHEKHPENPYGESKLMVEQLLSWYERIHGISFAALRYFNASGAALDGSRGEAHDPESHIIPNAINALLTHKPFTLFGTDYHTPDGSCVRDYIHVLDLVDAHVLALNKLVTHPGAYQLNVGTGKGYSNKEIVEMVQKVSGKKLEVTEAARRPGDADSLVADVSKITSELSFSPKHSDLETIVQSAWLWHSKGRS